MKKLLALLLAGAMALSMVACGGSEPAASADPNTFEPIVLKFANQHPGQGTASKSDQAICDAIKEATEGRVTVELYTDSSLGDYTSVVEEVMVGTIDMAHTTMVETYDQRMSGSMLPYLGSSYEELAKAYDPDNYLYKTIFEIGQQMGIRTFGFYCEGFAGVATNKPIQNANVAGADKGVTVRIPGLDTWALSTKALGFAGATIAYSDTYTSIQTGAVDGWQGGPPNLNYLYFRDVIDYFYYYQTVQEATQIYMSEKTWDKLLPQDQEAIQKIIQDECAKSVELAKQDDAEYMQLLRDEGVEIIEFTDAERAAFADHVRETVWPELAKNVGQDFIDGILESMK